MIHHNLDLFHDIYNAINQRYQKYIYYLLFSFLSLQIHFIRTRTKVIT